MRKIHPGKWAGSARRRAAPALKSASEAADTTIMEKPGGLVASSGGDAVQERRRLEGRWLRAVLQPAPGRAFPGGLDASFGTNGTATTDFGGDDDAAFALVRQSDGKLVAAGRSNAAGSADFALCRYDAEGELDPAFGTGGQVLTDFGGNRCTGGPRNARPCQSHEDCLGGTCVSTGDVAWALALQSDGKLVAAGERRACVGGSHDGERCQLDADCDPPNGVCGADFALARYNADGSVDLTFGSAGRVVTDFDGDDTAFALAVQPDGKIVVAGVSTGGGPMDF